MEFVLAAAYGVCGIYCIIKTYDILENVVVKAAIDNEAHKILLLPELFERDLAGIPPQQQYTQQQLQQHELDKDLFDILRQLEQRGITSKKQTAVEEIQQQQRDIPTNLVFILPDNKIPVEKKIEKEVRNDVVPETVTASFGGREYEFERRKIDGKSVILNSSGPDAPIPSVPSVQPWEPQTSRRSPVLEFPSHCQDGVVRDVTLSDIDIRRPPIPLFN